MVMEISNMFELLKPFYIIMDGDDPASTGGPLTQGLLLSFRLNNNINNRDIYKIPKLVQTPSYKLTLIFFSI